ncbi:hypothetical protein TNCV_1329861 [Trichonephila clavipes]|uniref:DDE-1 domain-containing protein n=1 Tax=Trichonephila clavipes TaxID=2585209 RepID=A0A8X6UPN9_TRICX|nr:hypothetical protein TNCV_1329861 [Trichonephila clavipes]
MSSTRSGLQGRLPKLTPNNRGYVQGKPAIGEPTVRAIKKNEAAIRKSVISGPKLSTKFASYTRDVLLERTERAIAIWIEEQVQRRIPNGSIISFVPEVEAHMKEKSLDFKALLIVDNAASHPELEHLNVQLIWPDNTTTQTSTLSDEIINLVHEIGGDGFNTFSHNDVDKLLVGDALSDNDIIDLTLDLTVDGVVGLEGDNDEQEKSTPLTGKFIQEGLQLCSKLENHFLINAPNSERASKLQRRATQNENEVCENPWPLPQISIAETVSSDDEGDLEPLRKRCKPLSDSDND